MSFPVTKDRDDPKICNCDNLLLATIDDLFTELRELKKITKTNATDIEKIKKILIDWQHYMLH